MPTDDERRSVAKRLRGLNGNISHVRRVYEAEGISILCDDQADYYQICDMVTGYLPAEHMHPCDYDELHASLADLIDPKCEAVSSHEEECDQPVSWFKHELSCGHSASWGSQVPPSYCPECGRRVEYDASRYI